jgi:hypothetical protein
MGAKIVWLRDFINRIKYIAMTTSEMAKGVDFFITRVSIKKFGNYRIPE